MIGSAGEVCCQIVKQIIPVMSLFVRRERTHLSWACCVTQFSSVTKGEARFFFFIPPKKLKGILKPVVIILSSVHFNDVNNDDLIH